MDEKTENKIEELKNDLLAKQFTKENIPSLNNSLRIFKTKSADSIYKNEIQVIIIIIYISLYYI